MKTLSDMLSKKQQEFMFTKDARLNFLIGSVRSGKTYISLLKWALKQKDFPYDKKNDFFIGYKKMYPNESDFKTLARFLGRNPRFLLHRYTLRKFAQIIKGK